MTRLIFLGPPGAGKGTQAQILASSFQVPHISTGDLLRAAVSQGTPLGQKAQAYMDQGELVPDQLILDMVKERLTQADAVSGWILDGFPRNVPQAIALDEMLESLNQQYDCVINLDTPDDVLVQRMLARGRKDDAEDVIRRRLEVYRDQTAPVIDFYSDRNLALVNGNQSLDAVTASLNQAIQAPKQIA